MRELIRQILKEETSPDDLRKGIDVAVKMLKKRYPFIVGWDYSDDPEEYTYKIYINIEVDYYKSLEYYGLKPHPMFHILLNKVIKEKEKMPYPYSLMNYQDEENFDDKEEYRKLQNDLYEIYEEMIPYKFKMKQSKAVFNQNDPKNLAVDNYIFVK